MRKDSVAIAPDVAIPHARTDAVERLVLAVGRSSAGIAFDAVHPSVRLIFLIGAPRQQVGGYLQLVATISRLLRREGAREALLKADSEDELRDILGRTINVAV
jgi:mannitol/fructose-specific phosphotransferase system IIA component (Ntr-type)